jgi:hypothetical protein
MNDIEKIFDKRAQIEQLRSNAVQIPFANEAEHTAIFNLIWRLNNEIKAIEMAVNNGVNYSTSQHDRNNQTSHDIGDDFTSIPMESCHIKPTPDININGILSILKILHTIPKSPDNLKEIEKLEKYLISHM